MRAGQLTERVSFYALTVTRDAYNSAVESYSKVIDTRAGVTYLSGDKTLSADEKFFTGTVFFTLRDRDTITESMLILWKNETYSISYIQPLIYEEGIRITAVKKSEGIHITPTAAPTGFTLATNSSTTATLNWTNNGAGDAVIIEFSTNGNNFTELVRLVAGTVTYLHSGLTTGTKYYYRIRAFREYNYSTYSEVLYVIPIVPIITGFDYDTEVLISRYSQAPSTALKTLIDTTIKSLKSNGLWSKLDVLYMFNLHDSQAALQNWTNRPKTATLVNVPTFVPKYGFEGDGATQAINLNYNPAAYFANFSLNDASVGINIYKMPAINNRQLLGGRYSTTYTNLAYTSPNLIASINNVNANQIVPFTLQIDHLYTYNRDSSTAERAFNNGTSKTTYSKASLSIPSVNMYALAYYDYSSVGSYSDVGIRNIFFGASLTDQENTDIATILNYFNNNVGGTF